ncbi:GNAT family N-acetyltransferase [Hymenobacter cellulosivorans]|uniref:GNAT family N-acetyltransferase n=1 Tax=Hymenobacter cellulosivorans TaxID=2932249 RepID=A0ABY4FAH5_9BACT|nr:GNAT family N-acetyltransferase [Hymenobacter cellulosivorans]UOQ53535.1 GNAT family N-acetyltransferase [Hymenobacter cellulosivorans]
MLPTLPAHVTLRPTTPADLEQLFHFQLDEEARYLAAFTPPDHTNKAAYVEKYGGFLLNPTIHMQTILVDGTIAGSISKFEIEGDAEITYWLDRAFWGRGIATAALATFLTLEVTRPLFGRVAFDNRGSQKVLKKCGFVRIGTYQGFANARQTAVAEFIYQLS